MTETSIWFLLNRAAELGAEFAATSVLRERDDESLADEVVRLQSSGIAAITVETNAGGLGGTIVDAATTVYEIGRGDLAAALVLAGHHAGIIGLRAAAGEPSIRAQIQIRTRGLLVAPIWPGSLVPGAELVDGFVVGFADRVELVSASDERVRRIASGPSFGLRRIGVGRVEVPDADAVVGVRAVRAALEASAIAGAVRASIDAATRLTRDRAIPRPVPGVSSATADPLSQAVLGAALGPADAARALAGRAAGDLDAQLAEGIPLGSDGVETWAQASLDVAIHTGLDQGRDVFEVVGTSGSGNAHGFDRLWRDVRVFSLARPAAERRATIGRARLEVA